MASDAWDHKTSHCRYNCTLCSYNKEPSGLSINSTSPNHRVGRERVHLQRSLSLWPQNAHCAFDDTAEGSSNCSYRYQRRMLSHSHSWPCPSPLFSGILTLLRPNVYGKTLLRGS